ncbi:hypothetical protein ACH5RR_013007 [Cinchona calisaya]|uniref:Reverse transcriptase zinc-binding domain-containing protein n=1 Tax=Cinchona calisaya TaxID=153742 RepID=A0ABD3A240_9GENT
MGKGDSVCKCCGQDMETLEHTFFFCPQAVKTWKIAPIYWEGITECQNNFSNWWHEMRGASNRAEGEKHFSLTVNILWQIWRARNEWVFNSMRVDLQRSIRKALEKWMEVDRQTEDKKRPEQEGMNRSLDQWLLPQEGCIRMNTSVAASKVQ